jgi:hypothetical protein
MRRPVEIRLRELDRRPTPGHWWSRALLSGRCHGDLDFLVAKRFGHSAGRTVGILYSADVEQLRQASQRLGRSEHTLRWPRSPPVGAVHVLIYNFAPTGPVGTPHQHLDTQLRRQVTLSIAGLDARRYAVQVSRIDTNHSGSSESEGTVSGANAVVHLPANGRSISLVQLTPDS